MADITPEQDQHLKALRDRLFAAAQAANLSSADVWLAIFATAWEQLYVLAAAGSDPDENCAAADRIVDVLKDYFEAMNRD